MKRIARSRTPQSHDDDDDDDVEKANTVHRAYSCI